MICPGLKNKLNGQILLKSQISRGIENINWLQLQK